MTEAQARGVHSDFGHILNNLNRAITAEDIDRIRARYDLTIGDYAALVEAWIDHCRPSTIKRTADE